LEIRIRSAAALRAELHQLPDSLLVDRFERILRQDLLVDILGKERTGVIAGVAEGHLCQVIRSEGEELRDFAELVCDERGARDLIIVPTITGSSTPFAFSVSEPTRRTISVRIVSSRTVPTSGIITSGRASIPSFFTTQAA